MNHRSLYAAFDIYPSAKGAATHIYKMAETLFSAFSGGLLFVIGNEKLPQHQVENNIEIIRIVSTEKNYLLRALEFSTLLNEKIQLVPHLELCHYRDIWGGLALELPGKKYKTVFEVNALTSVELPYRYPDIQPETIEKIQKTELHCLHAADKIIVPSEVIKLFLINKGINPDKIEKISNGAEACVPMQNINVPDSYIIYFGALQAWQGVDVLLKAFAGLTDYENLKLVICASNRERFAKQYIKLSEKLEIDNRVIWKFQLSKSELSAYVQHALISVVPLKETTRNIEQGCSPLKIFESMAARCCIVASDLPVVNEILTQNISGKLVEPDRPAQLSRAIRYLIDMPKVRSQLANEAYNEYKRYYTWKKIQQKLASVYTELRIFE